MKRLVDTSELNDTDFGLDGISPPFILNTSVLDGNGLLDGAEFLTTATGAASLGGLVAETADVFVTVEATADAPLGALDASAQAKARKSATASADLGALNASATTKVSKTVIASADLGGLDASATTSMSMHEGFARKFLYRPQFSDYRVMDVPLPRYR